MNTHATVLMLVGMLCTLGAALCLAVLGSTTSTRARRVGTALMAWACTNIVLVLAAVLVHGAGWRL